MDANPNNGATDDKVMKEAFEASIMEKLIVEVQRAEAAGRRKFEIQKRKRQESNKVKMKEKKKVEHALARVFSGRF